jgi:hypothetical protein
MADRAKGKMTVTRGSSICIGRPPMTGGEWPRTNEK